MSAPSPRSSLTQLSQPIPLSAKASSQRLIQGLADRELVQVGPGRVTEPFHVNHHDRAVNS